jgi:hypothetical protein
MARFSTTTTLVQKLTIGHDPEADTSISHPPQLIFLRCNLLLSSQIILSIRSGSLPKGLPTLVLTAISVPSSIYIPIHCSHLHFPFITIISDLRRYEVLYHVESKLAHLASFFFEPHTFYSTLFFR